MAAKIFSCLSGADAIRLKHKKALGRTWPGLYAAVSGHGGDGHKDSQRKLRVSSFDLDQ